MADSIEQRLDLIERRLADIELIVRGRAGIRSEVPAAPARPPVGIASEDERRRERTPAPPAPRSAPRVEFSQHPAPVSRAAPKRAQPPETPAPAARSVDWEQFFGLAVLGRVGVAAVLLAAGYFAQLAYRQMTPLMKVSSIYLLAAAFVVAGVLLRKKAARRYIALLWGGAAAAAYMAGIAARLRYGLVEPVPALVMLLGASALGHVLAYRLRHETLASIALAGAFAAPFLIGQPLDETSFILIYLLILHSWSAWMERVWSWRSARLIGVLGTAIVAAVWLQQHGAVDTKTVVHIHIYILGLIAPELLAIWQLRDVSQIRHARIVSGVALVEGITLLAAVASSPSPTRLPLLGLLAGGGWLAMALVLRPRAGRTRSRALTRGFARIGGVLFAAGAYTWVALLPGDFFIQPQTIAAWSLVLATALPLALRTRLGGGDIGAATAVALATWLVLAERLPQHSFVLLPAGVLAALLLLHFGRRPWGAQVGMWAGLAIVVIALTRGVRGWDPAWRYVALAAGAVWTLVAFFYSRRRQDVYLALSGTVAMILLGAAWFFFALFLPAQMGGDPGVTTPLFNAVTLAGVALALAAGRTASGRLSHLEPGHGLVARGVLGSVCLGLLLLVGHREVLASTRPLAEPARDALYVLYVAVAAMLAAAYGHLRRQRVLVPVGAGIALVAATIALIHSGGLPRGAWALVELLAPVAALIAITRLDRERRTLVLGAACTGMGLAGLSWAMYSLAGHFDAPWVVFNVRFLIGVLLVGSPFLLPRGELDSGRRRAFDSTLLFGGIVLGYLVGLAEVLDAVRDLRGAWPDVLVSVYTTLAAAALLIAGFLRKETRMRYAALAGFGAVILKVGLHDLSTASLELRIFVTGILGLVLLAAAFAYARRTARTDAPEPSTEDDPAQSSRSTSS